LYSHLFALYPADSPETTRYLTALLQTVSSSPSEQAPIKYRMYDSLCSHLYKLLIPVIMF
jgi:translation initiation factor 3 subunit M